MICQLGGEKDYGDKREQRTEQIGEVGDEVQVIIEYNSRKRNFRTQKLVNLLVDIENH